MFHEIRLRGANERHFVSVACDGKIVHDMVYNKDACLIRKTQFDSHSTDARTFFYFFTFVNNTIYIVINFAFWWCDSIFIMLHAKFRLVINSLQTARKSENKITPRTRCHSEKWKDEAIIINSYPRTVDMVSNDSWPYSSQTSQSSLRNFWPFDCSDWRNQTSLSIR